MTAERAAFSVADLTLIIATQTYGGRASFSVAEFDTVYVAPLKETARFAVSDIAVVSYPQASNSRASFTLAEFDTVYIPEQKEISRFTVSDITLRPQSITRSDSRATLTLADLTRPIITKTYDGRARFAVSDINIITVPTPEKFRVWDNVSKQWVHSPRYVWNQGSQEWRSLS